MPDQEAPVSHGGFSGAAGVATPSAETAQPDPEKKPTKGKEE